MNGEFLIAKYVSDLARQEPRNVGVIVWTKGKVATRFLEASSVDFIQDSENYVRWTSYWKELCDQKRLQLFNLPAVTNSTPRFLRTLQKTQQGNYLLAYGGHVLEDVNAANIDDAARFLFSQLVAPVRDAAVEREPTLADKCLKVLADAGITSRDRFQRRYPVTLRFNDFEQEIHFDFGTPDSLFNKVDLSEENNVTLAAGKCQTAIQYANRRKERCFSLFDSGMDSDAPNSTIAFLSTFSVPMDLSDPATPEQLKRKAG